jgi:hypothetical protein
MLLPTFIFYFLSVTFYESFVTVPKAKQGPPQAAKERMPRLAKTKHADFPSCLVINRPGGQGEGHKINKKTEHLANVISSNLSGHTLPFLPLQLRDFAF